MLKDIFLLIKYLEFSLVSEDVQGILSIMELDVRHAQLLVLDAQMQLLVLDALVHQLF